MRLAVAFLIGVVLGAAGLFLFLQASGRLRPPSREAVRRGDEPAAAAPETGVTGANDLPVPTPSTPAELRAGELVIPVVGVRRSELRETFFEHRGEARIHEALDIPAPRGTPVVAAADGTIRKLFASRAGGTTVYEEAPESGLMYYYAHLDRYAPALAEGRRVRRGELLGFVGTSGNAPAGTPHLHFAIIRLPPTREWWKGDAIDPYPILRDRGVTLAAAVPSAPQPAHE